MQINPAQLTNENNLITDYRNNKSNIMRFFDYGVSAEDIEKRLNDLKEYTFKRDKLAETLRGLHLKWDAPSSTYKNIERLKSEESVVVVGGQQAGLLTGPMYTINKLISIIQYAKKQEEKLNIPVIPVFWIAGEDHDFAEVNHIYLPKNQKMKKYTTPQFENSKKPLSDIPLDKDKTSEWINKVFSNLQETDYTKDLYEMIKGCMDKSKTYVDFFGKFIFQLFTEEGVVLIDSGDKKIRELESDFFINIIENQPAISRGVFETFEDLQKSGYQIDIDLDPADGHLFYHLKGERVLLVKNEAGQWVGKNNEIRLSTKEMLEIAKNEPAKLSNNVVTRPLMQEMLLPTLTFIGGPGEAGYWSTLKTAFHSLDLKMPPVLPRLSITYVDAIVEKIATSYSLNLTQVIHFGIEQSKKDWLSSKTDYQVEDTVKEIKKKIDVAHQPIRTIASGIQKDLSAMADKNLQYIYSNIDFLEKRILKTIQDRYSKEINDFNMVGNQLRPNEGLQERIWNPIYFINRYGADFLKETAQTSLSFTNNHYLVYI